MRKTVIAVVHVDEDDYVVETTGPGDVRSRDAARYIANQLERTRAIDVVGAIDLDVLTEQVAAARFEDVAAHGWKSEHTTDAERLAWKQIARDVLDRVVSLVAIG